MAFGPITAWQIEGEKVEAETDLIFLNSKITADSDCSHRLKTKTKTKTKLDPWNTSYDKPCSYCSVVKSCPTLCGPIDCRTPDISVPYYFPEFAQVHVH